MQHKNCLDFKVSGKYALFSDPVMRVGGEKSTYPVPTYEALKGIISAVYWKPTITWFIDKVRIIKPIHTVSKGVRIINYRESKTDLSCYSYLSDCEYQVQVHFEWNMNRPELEKDRNEGKHYSIAKKMIRLGGRRGVFLGTKECDAVVEPCVFGEGKGYYDEFDEFPLGLMFHGFTYADEAYSDETKGKLTVNFWRPVMKNGIIVFDRPENCTIHKVVRDMNIKKFSAETGNFSVEEVI